MHHLKRMLKSLERYTEQFNLKNRLNKTVYKTNQFLKQNTQKEEMHVQCQGTSRFKNASSLKNSKIHTKIEIAYEFSFYQTCFK